MKRVIPYEKLCAALERSKGAVEAEAPGEVSSPNGSAADMAALGVGTGMAVESTDEYVSPNGASYRTDEAAPLEASPSQLDESSETVDILQDDILD